MKPVIDISYWQNPRNINYDKLCASVDGVIIRATYGTRKDQYFERHYAECTKRGVPVGVYGFVTEYMNIPAQARAFLDAIEGKIFALGIYADVEHEKGAERLTAKTVRDYILIIESAVGRKMGIYTGAWAWDTIFSGVEYNEPDRVHWVAGYLSNWQPRLMPRGWSKVHLWQYSSNVYLPGYNYRLDANKVMVPEAEWLALHGEPVHYHEEEEPQGEPEKVLFEAKVKATATPYLNIRATHYATAAVVGRVYPGATISVYEVYAGNKLKPWYRIGVDRWVAGWYCTPSLPPVPQPPVGDLLGKVTPLWQRDPRWANVRLGTSNTTIGSYGCLLTSVTMYANHLLSANYTPPEMNEIINGVNGFVQGNLFRFASLWEAFPQIKADKLIRTPLTPAPLAEIDKILADGRPVIVETRINKKTEHWVLIVGKRDGKYVINDPLTGKQISFEDVYGSPPRWIYSIVSYA